MQIDSFFSAMKELYFLFVSIMLLGITTVKAQNSEHFRFGVKAGVNVSKVSLESDAFKADNRLGYFVGPIMYMKLPIPGLGLNLSALYSHQEAKVSDSSVKHNTLDIPLNVRYALPLTEDSNIFVEVGPQIAFTLGDKAFKEVEYFGKFKDSALSANIGFGFSIDHMQAVIGYNIPLGKTGDFNSQYFEKVFHTTCKEKRWQVSLAYFF